MFRPGTKVFALSILVVLAALPVDAKPYHAQTQTNGYYQPQHQEAVRSRRPGIRLNIPWEQWSNDVTPQQRAPQTRGVASRTWYVPAPDGQVRRYASISPQSQDYYYPQDAYNPSSRSRGYQVPDPYGAEANGVDPRFQKQVVAYEGREKPGTLIVDTEQRFLFLVQGGGQAIRYGIGVGKPGFEWSGVKKISRKAEWPDWTPPDEMIKRRPDLPRFMPGGEGNPLGARALYLGSSLYRIHGTNEPHTIGKAVSSGCIRMVNDDVIDLYRRVNVGARVIVI